MILDKLGIVLKKLGFDRPAPLDSLDAAMAYVEGRAAYVSQVTLYGYIKTRAGTQYPKLFDNETYLTSMKIARWHIFGASVCDLALFVAAQLVAAGHDGGKAAEMANRIIDGILADYRQDDIDPAEFAAMAKRGRSRVAVASWGDLADGPAAFQSSADALMRWAPIADELKGLDDEIVRNSIHLKWINVRREIQEIVVPDRIIATL